MSYKEIVLVTFCLCSTFAAPPASEYILNGFNNNFYFLATG